MAENDENQPDQRRLRKAVMDQLKRQQMEQQKKDVVKKLMDSAAYDRLMNIRLSNNELYSQLIDLIISLAQSGRIQGKLTEEQLLAILQKVTNRREPTLEFKHK